MGRYGRQYSSERHHVTLRGECENATNNQATKLTERLSRSRLSGTFGRSDERARRLSTVPDREEPEGRGREHQPENLGLYARKLEQASLGFSVERNLSNEIKFDRVESTWSSSPKKGEINLFLSTFPSRDARRLRLVPSSILRPFV